MAYILKVHNGVSLYVDPKIDYVWPFWQIWFLCKQFFCNTSSILENNENFYGKNNLFTSTEDSVHSWELLSSTTMCYIWKASG